MLSLFEEVEKTEELRLLNSVIRSCTRCPLAAGRTNAVCGEGNALARIFFIAQAPGEVEDRDGRMFTGPTGKVMDELFRESHLHKTEVYMTNLIKCRLPGNRKPQQNEIEACSHYLEKEIHIIQPDFLIPLGYHATKYVFDHYCPGHILPPDPAGKLFFCNSRKIYPLRHPSATLYNPDLKSVMERSFRKVALFTKVCKWYPVCPMKMLYQEGRLEEKWIELYCRGDWESCVRYQMEERGQPHSDNMLPDGTMFGG
ncbi:MAG: uracil-DNA glycosylase [Bacteroidales bacterium]|nr:uracil-DNA glycosylase [Bacteroidales bacterium]